MQVRNSKPVDNKFYQTKAKGGYSLCIKGSPTDASCDVLANCVGYACGRFNEIIGTMKYPYLNCNAENFIERAQNAGLKISNVPTLGGIMVWQKGTLSGNDGAGHVAIVERIDSENQIYTSESGYGGTAFWNSIRKNNNGRWGIGSAYTFRGCIINPAIGDVHYEPSAPSTPSTPTAKFKVGDKVIFTGRLYRDSYGNGAGQYRTNLESTIYLVNEKGSHPYNINNGLGWVRAEDLKQASESQKTGNYYTVVKGDTLWGIAKKFYGNGNRYSEIAKANNISNPDIIHVGQKLLIP